MTDRDRSNFVFASTESKIERGVCEPAITNEGMATLSGNEDSERVPSQVSNRPPAGARHGRGPRGLSGDVLRLASYGLTRSLGSFA